MTAAQQQVDLYGGSYNPPGVHHERVIVTWQDILGRTERDLVAVVPCGGRPDKRTSNAVDSTHRAAMCQMAFSDLPGVTLDLSDIHRKDFTRTWSLYVRYCRDYPEAIVRLVIGVDLIRGAHNGTSEMHRTWFKGPELFNHAAFVVLTRGAPLDPRDLPLHHQLVKIDIPGSSSEVRRRILAGEPIDGLVRPSVRDHIYEHRLYRG